jgi:hypothetical protein
MENKHIISVFAGLLAGVAMAFGAGKVLEDGTTAQLIAFSCHVTAQTCTAEFLITKDGLVEGEKQVRFSFNGKVRDEHGKELTTGSVPAELTACVQAFKANKFEDVAELKK